VSTRTLGLALFGIGAATVVGVSWVAPWWTSPVWSSAPTAHFDGTAWAVFGPIFMAMSIAMPVGMVLTVCGVMLLGKDGAERTWPPIVAALLVCGSLFYPPTLGFYPVVFGIAGGFILVFFFGSLWYWASRRRRLAPARKVSADLQMLGYVLFLLAAVQLCAVLGNPFSGLLVPERLEPGDLPYQYSMATRSIIYLAAGWGMLFVAHLREARADSQ